MKRIMLACCFAVATQVHADVLPTETKPVETDTMSYTVSARGPHHRVVERIEYETTPDGKKVSRLHTYTELATGMHYKDANGEWTESKAQIQILPNGVGAAVDQGQHKVIFPANINEGMIELNTPDGKWLRSRVLGLSYFDAATSNSVLIAEIKDSTGELHAPNVVIYPDAFTDFGADVRYTYTLAGFEQDIILREQPPSPDIFGLSPKTTRLEVLTEFFDPPVPAMTAREFRGVQDQELDFGIMKIGRGKAFSVNDDADRQRGEPVTKIWGKLEGRDFLIEQVEFEAVKDKLEKQLPHTAMNEKFSGQRRVAKERELPAARTVHQKSSSKFLEASVDKRQQPGYVLDYSIINGSQTNFTFQGDTTYFCTNAVYLYGAIRMEGGSVIKFSTNTAASIHINSSNFVCQTDSYRPAVFTAKDDNSVGEIISGSITNPTGYYGGGIGYGSDSYLGYSIPPLRNVRFSYLKSALTLGCNENESFTLVNAQFGNCSMGINLGGEMLNIENALFYKIGTNFFSGESETTWRGSHLTVSECKAFNDAQRATIYLTNSLFVAVTNLNGPNVLNSWWTTNHLEQSVDPSVVFQTVGAGNYYLTTNSPYRDAGTTNIGADLLEMLKKKTTYPPVVISNVMIGTSTNWYIQAARDTNAPDLGYHYPPLDYLVNEVNVPGSTLTLGPGVAVAAYGGRGLWTDYGGSLISQGTALAHNELCFYPTVQEQPVKLKGVLPSTILSWNGWTPPSSVDARFTDFNGMAGMLSLAYGYSFQIKLRDCYIGPGRLDPNSPTTIQSFTNNIFERANLHLGTFDWMCPLFFYNNTVRNSTVSIDNDYAANGYRTVRNNLFDNSTMSAAYPNYVAYDHNAYYQSTTALTPTHTGDMTLTNLAFASGFLGDYYIVSTNLLDTGNTNALYLGLYHFTTQTNQVKETNSTVDIGFHYVAVDGNGNPLDTDSDGTPDYLEDANGNGTNDVGESLWGLSILVQPQSQEAGVGDSATFTVTAGGVPPFRYQWLFNGTNVIAGATNSSFTLSFVYPTNAGVYSVLVTNATGYLASSNAVLDVTCVAAPSGLVAWWQAENNANDSIGDNSGTTNGGVTYTNGAVGSAFRFNGTNGLVTIPDSTVLRPTNLTIEAWVKFDSLSSATTGGVPAGLQYIVFKKNTRSTEFNGYSLLKWRVSGQDYLAFAADSASGQEGGVLSTTTVSTNVWYHVAGVRGPNYIQIYVNGRLEAQDSISYPQDYGDVPLYLGASNQDFDGKLKGRLDEVSLYNRALSSNEIAAIYYAGSLGKCPPPPTIISQPGNRLAMVGDTITISVVAAGVPSLIYQWYFEANAISGATNATLTLSGVETNDSGNYSVLVVNQGGSVASSNAVLTVAECFPAVDVALVLDRSGSMSGQKLTNARSASIAFLGHLDFTNDQAAIVSFNNTAITNQTLTGSSNLLAAAINSITNATGQTYMSNAIYAAQLELTSGRHNLDALPVMVLLSDGQPTGPNATNAAIAAANSAKNQGTRIFTVGLGDAVPWIMQTIASSTNDYYYATNSSDLTGLFDTIAAVICRGTTNTTIQISPTNQTACPGSTAAFTTTATGISPFTYVWKRNGSVLSEQTNDSLTLSNISSNDAGIYSVELTATGGAATNFAMLTVLTNTSATALTNRTTCAGSTVVFSTDTSGSSLSYAWKKNGAVIGGQTGNSLTLNNVSSGDAGTYCVEVSGDCGNVTNCATLTVYPAPSVAFLSPTNTELFALSPTNILLTVAITDYCGTTTGVGFFTNTVFCGNGTLTTNGNYEFLWQNVPAGTNSIVVWATNNLGQISSDLVVITNNFRPTITISTPTNLQEFVEVTNIFLSADASDADGTVDVSFYQITNGALQLIAQGVSTGGDTFTNTWTDLNAGSYAIVAVATDDRGASVASGIRVFKVSSTNIPPAIWITYPTNNEVFRAGADITITATATNGSGTVTNVDFYVNGNLIGSDSEAPYNITECCWRSGIYQITAKATDDLGYSALAAFAEIIVSDESPVSGEGFWDTTFTIPDEVFWVFDMAHYGSYLYCQVTTDYEWDGIFRWDGTNWLHWHPIDLGVTENILAVAANETGVFYANVDDNGVSVLRKNDGEPELIGFNSFLSSFADWSVWHVPLCLKTIGPDLYLGGFFIGTTNGINLSVEYIAKYNPVTETWDQAGNGLDGPVFAIGTYEGDLVVGGRFNVAGEYTNVNNIARLKNGRWEPIGSGVSGINASGDQSGVYSIAVCGTNLFAGGDFTVAGDVNDAHGIALWNGKEWQRIGQGVGAIPSQPVTVDWTLFGLPNPVVLSLAAQSDSIIVAGKFTAAWGADDYDFPVSGIAKVQWSEAQQQWIWSEMDLGAFNENYAPGAYSGVITSVQLFDDDKDGEDDIFVGGYFSFAGRGMTNLVGGSSPHYQGVARWKKGNDSLSNTPVVSISYPTNGSIFTNDPSNIVIAATAESATSIVEVVFYDNGSIIGSDTTAETNSYEFSWNNPTQGLHLLTAVATDANNLQRESLPVLVSIKSPTNAIIARDDTYTIVQGSLATSLLVLTNDSPESEVSISSHLISLRGNLGTATVGHDGRYVVFNPFPHLFGTTRFGYNITNIAGSSDSAWVTVDILARPTVQIHSPYDRDQFITNSEIPIAVTASDYDGVVTNVQIIINGMSIFESTNVSFSFDWTTNTAGFYTVFAVATDSDGLTNVSQLVTLVVTNSTPSPNGPIADISNLSEAAHEDHGVESVDYAVIKDGFFDLQGTARDPDDDPVSYAVMLYRPQDLDETITDDFNELVEISYPYANLTPGTLNYQGYHDGAVTNASLGTLDLTSIPNGIYYLVLRVRGGTDETNAIVRVQLDSQLKIGQFSFSEQDLVIPVNGIPLTVTRTYDSLNSRAADFGYSWTYALNSMDIELDETRENISVGGVNDPLAILNDGEDDNGLPRTVSIRSGGGWDVTLTLPDGKRTTFTFDYDGLWPKLYAKWNAPEGTHAKLTMIGNNEIVFSYSGLTGPAWASSDLTFGNAPLENQDIEGWILETQDGTKYEIRRGNPDNVVYQKEPGVFASARVYGKPKLTKIMQRTGDTIVISDNDISHYNAASELTRTVLFDRDAQGRITAIRDPNAATNGLPSVKYVYNRDTGNLIWVQRLTDRAVGTYQTVKYHYDNPNFPHYITSIEDPRGIPLARNEYDDDGRLIAIVDADGKRTEFVHSISGKMEIVTDRLGHTNIYAYDTRGNITATTNAVGGVMLMAYDDNDNKTNEIVYLNGQPYATNRFTYSTDNLPLTSTDPLGHTSTFTYNSYGQMLTSVDPRNNGTTNTYDGSGNLANSVDALGNKSDYFYNSLNLLVGTKDALGTVTTNYYDATGNLTATATLDVSGAILSTNTFAYDDNGNRTNSTVWRRVNGAWTDASTRFVYDAQNRVTQTIDPDGGTNTVVYNSIGKQEATIDKLDHTTSYEYDAQGRLFKTTYADTSYELSTYDANGNRTGSVDRAGRTTSYNYDALSRMTNTVYADNTSTRTVYDDLGRVKFTVDARGTTNAFGYDAAGRQVAVTNAYGISGLATVTRQAYDASGNLTNTVDNLGRATDYEYDSLNRRVKTIFPATVTGGQRPFTLTGYDALGRRYAETNEAGVITRFGYDGDGKLTAVTNAWGTSDATWATYAYDEAGNQTNQVDALGRQTKFEFDSLGRRIKRTLPGNQSETFGYNATGNLLAHTNFNGLVITNEFDVMNQLVKRSQGATVLETYSYDAAGQLTNRVDGSGSYTWVYDNRGRVATNSTPVGTLFYQYDPNGNLTNLYSSTANGVSTVYQYDALNRITNVIDNRLTGTKNTAYTFDGVGNLSTLKYPNAVTNLWQYDARNRLTNQITKLNTATLASFAYQLELAGNRTNLNETLNGSSRTFAWQYNNAYRLTNETISGTAPTGTISYKLDPVGNRTNRTSSVTGIGDQTPTYNTNDWLNSDSYDNNGNTTGSGGNTYQYDWANRLTNANSGAVQIVYNAAGQRIKKVAGGTTTIYLVDTLNPSGFAQVLEELVVSGGTTNLSKVYAYGLDLISQRQPGVSTNFFTYDGHGSTRLLTDSGGNVVNSLTYDAYGTLIASNVTPATVYLYCGEQLDTDLGVYYLRARYLNTGTGRFSTMDTAEGSQEYPQSLHLYLYVADDPVNFTDPSGHEIEGMLAAINIGSILAQIPSAPSTSQGASAVAPRTVSVYISVDPTDMPTTFRRSDVQKMLQDQLSANVFNGLIVGQNVRVRIGVEPNGPGTLQWIGKPKSIYTCRVIWVKSQLAVIAYSNHAGGITVDVDRVKQAFSESATASESTQFWVNLLAHEAIWQSAGGHWDNFSVPVGEISHQTGNGFSPYTVLPSSRRTLIKDFGLRSR